jgi:hypothetical protein
MSETEGIDLNATEPEPPSSMPPIGQISSRWQQAASLALCAVLIVTGLYILSNYLRALVWALVLAVALWPAYDRLCRKTRRSFVKRFWCKRQKDGIFGVNTPLEGANPNAEH